jgi:predicted RNase H-like HicB family nuclease
LKAAPPKDILEGMSKSVKKTRISAVLWREGRQFVSKCPELGVASCGANMEEALENLKEAVDLYLENAKALGMLADVRRPLQAEEKYATSFDVALP